MAARGFKAQTDSLSLDTAVKTLLQVRAPTNFCIVVHEIWATLKDATSAKQVVFEAVQTDAAGTAAGDLTLEPWGPKFGTIQSTAKVGPFTVEPTLDSTRSIIVAKSWLPAQAGLIWRGNEVIEPGKALSIRMYQDDTATGEVRLAALCSE